MNQIISSSEAGEGDRDGVDELESPLPPRRIPFIAGRPSKETSEEIRSFNLDLRRASRPEGASVAELARLVRLSVNQIEDRIYYAMNNYSVEELEGTTGGLDHVNRRYMNRCFGRSKDPSVRAFLDQHCPRKALPGSRPKFRRVAELGDGIGRRQNVALVRRHQGKGAIHEELAILTDVCHDSIRVRCHESKTNFSHEDVYRDGPALTPAESKYVAKHLERSDDPALAQFQGTHRNIDRVRVTHDILSN